MGIHGEFNGIWLDLMVIYKDLKARKVEFHLMFKQIVTISTIGFMIDPTCLHT